MTMAQFFLLASMVYLSRISSERANLCFGFFYLAAGAIETVRAFL